jgi:hypothetical protein
MHTLVTSEIAIVEQNNPSFAVQFGLAYTASETVGMPSIATLSLSAMRGQRGAGKLTELVPFSIPT